MTTPDFERSRKRLYQWALTIACAACALIAANAALAYRVSVLRERSPWTYLKAAESLKARNNWAGAVQMLEEAANRDPQSPVAWERMGQIQYNQEQWEKALFAFQNALDRGSRDTDARGKVIWCLIHLRRFDGAAAFAKACIDEGDPSPYLPRYAAEAYRRAGRYAEAIPYLDKALEGFPDDLYLMELLLQCYKHLGNQQKAAEIQQRIERLQGR